MRDRILYLHIGAGKTGTSALQQFFFQNRSILQSHDIIYPEIGIHQYAHHRLATSCYELRERQFFMPDPDIPSVEEYLQQVIHLPGDVLLSSEYWWHGRHAYKLVSLCDHFKVRIVAYVRRQDNLLMSRYNQQLKVTGEPIQNVLHFLPRVEHAMNYDLVLSRWEKQFGRDAILVRPYEKQQFYGGSIFGDFLHYVMGLELTEEYRLPRKDINPKLSRDAMDYVQMTHCLGLEGGLRDRLVGALLKYSLIAEEKLKNESDKHDLMSPRECLAIIEKYAKINEKVARTYLGREDGRLFYDPLPNPETGFIPYPGFSPETAGEITGFIRQIDHDLYQWIDCAMVYAVQSANDDVKQSLRLLLPGFDSANKIGESFRSAGAQKGDTEDRGLQKTDTMRHPVIHALRRYKGQVYYAWLLLMRYCGWRPWAQKKKDKCK